jgi:hypothetical protein
MASICKGRVCDGFVRFFAGILGVYASESFVNPLLLYSHVCIFSLCYSAEVVNATLQLRHPFFTCVLKEGLLLYSSAQKEAPPAAFLLDVADGLCRERMKEKG